MPRGSDLDRFGREDSGPRSSGSTGSRPASPGTARGALLSPLSEKGFLELVQLAYQAGLDPERWELFLERFAWETRGFAPGIFVVDPKTQVSDLELQPGLDDAWIEAYRLYYVHRDVRRREVQKKPPGAVVRGQDLIPDPELEKTEFYNDFLRPQGFHHIALALPFKSTRRVAALRVMRERGAPGFEDRELAWVRRLVPHVKQAIHLHERLAHERARARDLAAVLDRLRLGVFLLDDRGRVVARNEQGERLLQRPSSGLALSGGRLVAGDPREDRELSRLIARAVESGRGRRCDPGGVVRLGPPAALCVRLVPLPGLGSDLGARRAVAAAFVSEAGRGIDLSPEPLRARYGLTRAQARVAALIAQGLSVEEAAGRLGRSKETVRTQLKQVFARTGARSQAELVRLLLSDPFSVIAPKDGNDEAPGSARTPGASRW